MGAGGAADAPVEGAHVNQGDFHRRGAVVVFGEAQDCAFIALMEPKVTATLCSSAYSFTAVLTELWMPRPRHLGWTKLP